MEVEAELKSKFSNIFIMLLLAIQNNDIDNVKHYLTDELYEKYSKRCEELKKKNQMQLYDEANVKKIEIFDSGTDDDGNEVYVIFLTSRYMDYIIDLNTGKKISGVDDHRVEKDHDLIFKRKIGVHKGNVVKCPGCGANLDVNATGRCEYCGTIHSAESYDFILTSITGL
jgi:hypothetical protein